MKKTIAAALALLLCGFAGCAKTPPAETTTEGDTAAAVTETAPDAPRALTAAGNVAWAGWSDRMAEALGGALNEWQTPDSSVRRLPVFKISSTEELTAFREARAKLLSLDAGYDETDSFSVATAWYDDAFFAEKTLLIAYVEASSGSFRYGLKGVEREGDTCRVLVEQLNRPEVYTCDMAGWFVIAELPNAELAGCESFDALMIS